MKYGSGVGVGVWNMVVVVTDGGGEWSMVVMVTVMVMLNGV